MKKVLFVPTLALVAAASFSCSKENITCNGEDNIPDNKEVIVFSEPQTEIGAISAGTKTTLDGVNINWENAEYISLFNEGGDRAWTYELTAGAGTQSATFTAQGEPQTGFTYAIYPQTSNAPVGATISTNLESEQTYSENGFPTLYPMGAKTDDGKSYVFENLATILRLPLKGVGTIASITIESVGEEPLAGAAIVDFSGENPVMSAADGASTSVTLNCSGSYPSLNESEPVYFNFVLFPGSYSRGFRFEIKESNGNSTTVTTADAAIELIAGTFKNFDAPLTIDTPQGWNIYGTITGGDGTWIELQGGHGTYFCSNVIASENNNEFNIRYAEDDNQIFGIGYGEQTTDVPELVPYSAYQGQDGTLRIAPSETGYDIYFIEDTKKVIITETGTAAFSVIGNINGTLFNTDFPMYLENGWLVAKGIEFTGDAFKIRTTGSWEYYEIGAVNCTVGNVAYAWNYTGSANMTVTGAESGKKYDIYLDMKKHDPGNTADNMTVWVMPEGQIPGQAAE